jgi:hypothetical protein
MRACLAGIEGITSRLSIGLADPLGAVVIVAQLADAIERQVPGGPNMTIGATPTRS